MTKICWIILICLDYFTAQGQPTYQLSGKVTDSAGIPLSHATIQYIAASDTALTFTGDEGNFSINNLLKRNFRLVVTMKGYRPFNHAFSLPDNERRYQLQLIALQINYDELDPVTVTQIRPVVIAGDTVIYNTAAFPVRDGDEVEDILKRLPGVEVDMDGNVIVQGKKIGKVLVNGKEFFGSDLLLAIRNLPADIVGKLQIIDDYGDEARLTGVRSGESAKVLNIVLKPDKRNGEFGRIETAGGTQDKYSNMVLGNAFKGDRQLSVNGNLSNNSQSGSDLAKAAGFSYADRWGPYWDGTVTVNGNSQNPHSAAGMTSATYYPGQQIQQSQNNHSSSLDKGSAESSELTFKPDSHTTFRFSTSGNIIQSTSQVSSNFTSQQQDSGYIKSTNGQSINNDQSNGQNLNADLYFEKLSPHSRRRFNMQATLGYSAANQTGHIQSDAIVVADSTSGNSIINYLTTSHTDNLSLNLSCNYFLPLGPIAFIQLGYTSQLARSHNNFLTQQPDSNTRLLQVIDSLSQVAFYRSAIQQFHLGYTAQFHRLDLTASLDAQPGQQQGTAVDKGAIITYNYFSLLPMLQVSWRFDNNHKLSFGYNSRPNLPGLQQLAPFTNLSNPQYPVTGNPGLKPSYTYSFSAHYEQSAQHPSQFYNFGFGLSYSSTQHSIIQDVSAPRDNSQIIQATTFVNAGETNKLAGDYHLSLPALINRRIRINCTGDWSTSQLLTLTDSSRYRTQVTSWGQSIHIQLLVPDVIESNFSMTYSQTHSVYPAMEEIPAIFRSALFVFNSKEYLFHYWAVSLLINQSYTTNGVRLQAAQTILSSSVQRQFLTRNMATIMLTGYNLLNQAASAGQYTTPTTIIESRPTLTGRYFLLSFLLKLNRFHQ
jgi:hypothetical protein